MNILQQLSQLNCYNLFSLYTNLYEITTWQEVHKVKQNDNKFQRQICRYDFLSMRLSGEVFQKKCLISGILSEIRHFLSLNNINFIQRLLTYYSEQPVQQPDVRSARGTVSRIRSSVLLCGRTLRKTDLRRALRRFPFSGSVL